jgi:ubiquinone/menaquinone biosynthesis C-methylase UbiE
MVLDKSTIDALMCSDDPLISVCKMVEEVYRVLKSDGVYLIISYASPSLRL